MTLIISDPQLREVAGDKLSQMRHWLDTKLEEAKIAASHQEIDDDDESKCIADFVGENIKKGCSV